MPPVQQCLGKVNNGFITQLMQKNCKMADLLLSFHRGIA
jgi:hypothetical protein